MPGLTFDIDAAISHDRERGVTRETEQRAEGYLGAR